MSASAEESRIAAAKAVQDHDADPPRCATCCYCRRTRREKYLHRTSGNGKPYIVKAKGHPVNNPMIDKCTFGNFEVKPHHVCNEWHGRDGSKIVDDA